MVIEDERAEDRDEIAARMARRSNRNERGEVGKIWEVGDNGDILISDYGQRPAHWAAERDAT